MVSNGPLKADLHFSSFGQQRARLPSAHAL